jgi:hypothetical protein
MKQRMLLLLVVLLLGALTACSDPGDPVTEACAALQTVNTARRAADLVGPATDILDIIAVQTQLTNSWRSLVSAVEKLDPAQIPDSLVTANQEFQAVPVSTSATPTLVALTTVSRQAAIAEGVVNEFTPVCLTLTTP